jgi:GT2 family glycosyltransferase
MHSSVSIMLATFNRLPLSKRMFASLFENTQNIQYRLIVVDNGSTDGTVDWLKSLVPPNNCQSFDVHYNATNRGIAIARSQALKIADRYNNTFLCTADNDILLPNNWLQNITEILIANPNFSVGINFEGTQYPLITLNSKTFQIKPQGNLGTALMMFPRRLHEQIGFFDCQSYQMYSCEDSDWGWRSRLAGYQLGYLKENGYHFGIGTDDTGEYRAEKDKWNATNIPIFRRNCALYANKQKPLYIPFNEEL